MIKRTSLLIILLFLFINTSFAQNFTFIHITDTHIGSRNSYAQLQQAIDEINGLEVKPALVINTGDLTELGTENQFQAYKGLIAKLDVPIYNILGNHDTKWSDACKERFQRFFGQLYYSFDYANAHFIGLDTSIPLEQHGIMDLGQLNWLEADLAKLPPDKPVFLFCHHPPVYPDAHFVKDDDQLMKILASYNVKLILTGHGHINRMWFHNDIALVMTTALYSSEAGFKLIEVSDEKIGVSFKGLDNPSIVEEFTLPTKPIAPKIYLTFISPKPNQTLYSSTVNIKVKVENPENKDLKLYCQADDIRRIQLSQIDQTTWGVAADLPPGKHFVVAIATDGEKAYSAQVQFYSQYGKVTKLWEFATGSLIQASPTISENTVYFGSWVGEFYALDLATGKELWNYKLDKPIISTAAILGNIVYFGCVDGNVYALDKSSGKLIWNYPTQAPIVSSPLVDSKTLYIGSGDHHLYALEASSGKLIWKYETGGLIQCRPRLAQNSIYFGAWDNKFRAVDIFTGQGKWSANIGKSFYYSPAICVPAIAQNQVIITSPDTVYALDVSSGTTLWTHEAHSGYSSSAIIGEKVFLGTLDGKIYALDLTTGELLWETKLGDVICDSSIQIIDDTIYITTLNGFLYALAADRGKIRWCYKCSQGYIFSNPAIANNIAVVTSMDGTVCALLVK